eukprot:CAMPEP_0172489322 /NCGR_PEP_ID=MMETSP1066-20121228/19237_1 /TAXON_ID=671091 /ORGANISM="Coscinodiscus wailesii, Strain CCMP2513" /LENGTH=41 /DNA_ID= /DNA_START= /DNA_END= /DNA_ORIENTATION=
MPPPIPTVTSDAAAGVRVAANGLPPKYDHGAMPNAASTDPA